VDQRCLRCGGSEAVICASCTNDAVDRCVARIRELMSDVARLQRLVQGQAIVVTSIESGPAVEDHG